MDGNPPDDPEIFIPHKVKRPGWPSTALEQDKKSAFWMGGVLECFSTVVSLFSKTELKPVKDDGWEVPFEELSEFLYIGSGAQGIVFRGNFRGELVAVKKLRERSETNIKHLRKLDHENIVRFRGVSINGPIPCIIMEYCEYGPLYEYLHSGTPVSAEQTFKWAKQIAHGMAYLHSNKIIHRDLKSPNLLIADQLTVKVSDFGTSREWNNVSTIMSFTGTVAWMAPEVIRHEPCSERVDVWSYGVVLWELLTQEVPYKAYETHAIMWGVGTATLSLPIPESCPLNLRLLLEQCWRRTPRHRPPFKIIAANLEFTGDQFTQSHGDCFSATQVTWRKEVKEAMKFLLRPSPRDQLAEIRREELVLARNSRALYEKQMNRANELYLEVSALRLELEQREAEVAEREEALKFCKCTLKKGLKYVQRQFSSSSDTAQVDAAAKSPDRRNQTAAPAQIVVNYVDKGNKTVCLAVAPEKVKEAMKDVAEGISTDAMENNNVPQIKAKKPVKKVDTEIQLKDMVAEQNGNLVKKRSGKANINDNYIPEIAHV